MTRKIHVKFSLKTDNTILNLKFNAVVFFYLLCDYGNSLVLHCEHQHTYPSNQGEVIQGKTAIGTFLGVMELHVLRICLCYFWGGEVEGGD